MAQHAIFSINDPQSDIDAMHEHVRNMSKFAFIHESKKEDMFNTLRPMLKKYKVYDMPQPRRGYIHRAALWVAINFIDCQYTNLEDAIRQTIEDYIAKTEGDYDPYDMW